MDVEGQRREDGDAGHHGAPEGELEGAADHEDRAGAPAGERRDQLEHAASVPGVPEHAIPGRRTRRPGGGKRRPAGAQAAVM